jgi:hypothetical protein
MNIGKYSVPEERIYPQLVDWTTQIYNKYTTTDADPLVVAQLMGHKSIGGAFNAKTAKMSAYGLIERRGGTIRVTEIGRKIIFPSEPKEKYEGIKAAIFKVDLWERLYQEYTAKGAELPSNFWVDLAKIAEIPPDDAKNKAEWVGKAYLDDIAYLKAAERDMATTTPTQSSFKTQTDSKELSQPSNPQIATSSPIMTPNGQITFTSPDDRIQLTVPRSARHIGMLKSFVEDALKVIEEELVAEAKLVTEREKTKSKDALAKSN